MVTVHRETGLRFVIYTDDHEPAHVHVIGDGTAKIGLGPVDGKVELVHSVGLNAGDLRRTMRIVTEHRAALLECWKDIHG